MNHATSKACRAVSYVAGVAFLGAIFFIADFLLFGFAYARADGGAPLPMSWKAALYVFGFPFMYLWAPFSGSNWAWHYLSTFIGLNAAVWSVSFIFLFRFALDRMRHAK
jgi:hypothetical protein